MRGRPRWMPDGVPVGGRRLVRRPADHDRADPQRVVGQHGRPPRDVFLAVGGFRVGFGKLGDRNRPEDTELCLRMSARRRRPLDVRPGRVIRHGCRPDARRSASSCAAATPRAAARCRWPACTTTARRSLGTERDYLRSLPKAVVRHLGAGLAGPRASTTPCGPAGWSPGWPQPASAARSRPCRRRGLRASPCPVWERPDERHERQDLVAGRARRRDHHRAADPGVRRRPAGRRARPRPGRAAAGARRRSTPTAAGSAGVGAGPPVHRAARHRADRRARRWRVARRRWPPPSTPAGRRSPSAPGRGRRARDCRSTASPRAAEPAFLARRREVLATAPPITVVVCTRERPGALARCLDSLLAQEYPSFRVLVVDNAPETAATAEVVRSAARRGAVEYLRGTAGPACRSPATPPSPPPPGRSSPGSTTTRWPTRTGWPRSPGRWPTTRRPTSSPASSCRPSWRPDAQLWFEQFGGHSKGRGFRAGRVRAGDRAPAEPALPAAAVRHRRQHDLPAGRDRADRRLRHRARRGHPGHGLGGHPGLHPGAGRRRDDRLPAVRGHPPLPPPRPRRAAQADGRVRRGAHRGVHQPADARARDCCGRC